MRIPSIGGLGGLLGALLIVSTGWAQSQVIERETKVTGPRGRTIERDVRVERGPGMVDRSVDIRRPGGTYHQETRVYGGRPPHAEPVRVAGGPLHGPIVRERVVVERRPATAVSVGVPFFSLFVGSPPPPPPPPVFFAPAPVFVEPLPPPPVVVYQPPIHYGAPPVREKVVVDPFQDALGRLRSRHDNSRRDGCRTLGRMGDPRAVPGLLERLRNDDEKEVREAAAIALGEIGDPQARPYLEQAAGYDKKQDVRKAAMRALDMLANSKVVEETVIQRSDEPESTGPRTPFRSSPSNSAAPTPAPPPPAYDDPDVPPPPPRPADPGPSLEPLPGGSNSPSASRPRGTPR